MESDDHAHQLSIMSSPASEQMSPTRTDCSYKDIDSIAKDVENELHLSAMVSIAEYVKTLVEEEAREFVDSSKDGQLNEVTFNLFNKNSPFPLSLPLLFYCVKENSYFCRSMFPRNWRCLRQFHQTFLSLWLR